MKPTQLKTVITAVRSNVSLLKATKGESPLVGLEGFTEEMLEVFDSLYDVEVSKL